MNKHILQISLFVMLISIFLTACQPTPEEPAVIYGRDLEEKIARSSASLAAYDAPESWQETLEIEGNNAKMVIDAAIIVPDVAAFPVYIAKKEQFTGDSIKPLLDYFLQGRDVIKPEATKAELEESLVYARLNEEDEQWISELEEMCQNAPETVEYEYVKDWTVGTSDIGGLFELENGEYGSISVDSDTFIFMNGCEIKTDYILALNSSPEVGKVSISEADAVKAAEEVLSDLGLDRMTAYSLEKAQLHTHSKIGIFSWPSEEPRSKGYIITFVSNIDGISARADEGTMYRTADEFAYTAPFYPEEIQIFIDEKSQMQSFIWSGSLNLSEKISENVNMMPFEDVQGRIRNMLVYIFAYAGQPVTIDSISLNMTLVSMEDEPDAAMYVPAWYIHCVQDAIAMQMNESQPGKIEQTIVLNAIDGGRVQVMPPIPEVGED